MLDSKRGINIPNKKIALIIPLIITAIALTSLTAAVLNQPSQNIPTNGSILTTANLGAYTDSACTINCTSIDWSAIAPGSSVTRTIYIKNTGTAAETLSISTSGWNPTNANGPIALSWNREGTTLAAGSSINATLTLTVSPSITGISTFSFNTIITGTQIS